MKIKYTKILLFVCLLILSACDSKSSTNDPPPTIYNCEKELELLMVEYDKGIITANEYKNLKKEIQRNCRQKDKEKKNSDTNKGVPFVVNNNLYRVIASSTLSRSFGLTYNANNTIDGNLQTWWSPLTKQAGKKWLKVDLSQEMNIKGMKIHAGSHFPNFVYKGTGYGNLYLKNRRIKHLKIEFSDQSEEYIYLKDIDNIQEIYFDKTHFTSSVKLVILDKYDGYKWPDYCVSELQLIAIK